MIKTVWYHRGMVLRGYHRFRRSEEEDNAVTMKIFRCFLILLFVFPLASCSFRKLAVHQEQVSQTPPSRPSEEPGASLFAAAEKWRIEKIYPTALSAYKNYLYTYPNAPRTADALLAIADIYRVLKKPALAVPYYQRLIVQYPDSVLIPQAKLGILTAFAQTGDYQKVVSEGPAFLKSPLPRGYFQKISLVTADGYRHLNRYGEAVSIYAMLVEKSTGADADAALKDMRAILDKVSRSDLTTLLSRTPSPRLKPWLLLQLGKDSLRTENPEDALQIFAQLTTQYPKTDAAVQAAQLIASLKKRSDFKKHTLGCILPLSGTYELYGKQALKGVELAQNQFIAAHPDAQLTVLIKDTGSDPNKTVAAVKELADAGVAAIIGPVATADIAAQEAQKHGIPIITLTQKPDITQIGDRVFRNFMTYEAQANAIASFAIQKLGLHRFGVLYPDEPYGINFKTLFQDKIAAAGGEIVLAESYNSTQTDFRDILKSFTSSRNTGTSASQNIPSATGTDASANSGAGIEALFIPEAPSKLSVIAPQLPLANLQSVVLLGTNLWHSSKLMHMAGPSLQGAIVPDGFFVDSISDNVQQFVRSFRDAFTEAPDYIEAVSYDTAMMMFQIVSNPDMQFRSSIVTALLDPAGYHGVTGDFRFDKNREVEKKLYLLQIKGDRFVETVSP